MTTLESKQLRLGQPLWHLVRPGGALRIPYVICWYYLCGDEQTLACVPKPNGGVPSLFALADCFLTEEEAREAAKITTTKGA